MALPACGGSARRASLRTSVVLRRGVRGERARLHRGQQVLPHQVHHAAHVLRAAGDRDDRVLLGHHDAELAERAVAAVDAVAAAPELVAVALLPVALRVAAVRHLARRGRLDPRGGQQLPPLPLALLQVELAEARDVLGPHAQAEAAERHPLLVGVPGRVLDAERLEEPRPQVVEHASAGDLLHDRREHVGGRRVVDEVRPGLVRDRQRQEEPRQRAPRSRTGKPAIASAWWPVDIVSRSRTRIAFEVRARLGGRVLREGGEHAVVERQLPLGDRRARRRWT